jgi:rod shape-determining protein MreC
MTPRFASRLARRRAAVYGGLLGGSILLMAVSANPFVVDLQDGIAFAFRPIQGAIDGAGRTVVSIGSALAEIDQLRTENERLRADNERLRIENQQTVELQRQLDQLTGLLQLRNGFQYSTVSATVIARESSEFRRVVTLDRGSDDGVAVGDVVIASGGAVAGRVTEVGGNFARVLLLSDTGSTVIGQLVGSAATGEVVGQLGGTLIMSNIDSTAKVSIGEEVVTAGIELAGGIRSPFPKGLVIGLVVDVSRDANEVVQTAFLEPAAPLDSLEWALVITSYQGGLPPPDEQPTICQPTDGGTLPNTEQPCVTPTPGPLPSSSALP